ncbi:protein kinase C-binding protein 1 isoform X3 [Solenopsis invicta]|uniref:protein kinase C-binding protein 1 isoform X3 n=1 Tax=Solenopsis invicta TaxID=13686 RepID=UPI000E33EA60|nr:protein kinase C-binding protein 1 isoform X3 [Solenopsis invicta]
MNKMASQENSESLMKSTMDNIDTMAQPKMDENISLTASLPVEQHAESTDTAANTKEKDLMSDATNDCTSVQKNDSDNTLKDKDQLKSLVIDENKQDDNKTDKKGETQDVTLDPNINQEKEVKNEDAPIKGSVWKRKRKSNVMMTTDFLVEESKTNKKKETQNVASLTDPQNIEKEKEVKNEEALTKEFVLKRKRKSNATTTAEFPVEENKTDKKKETQNITSLADPQNTDDKKEVKNEDTSIKESVLKRKRKSIDIFSITSIAEVPTEENNIRSKRKKLKTGYDRFCWRCHKEKVDAYCTACPRSWHRKCIGGTPSSLEKWICGECATILKAENAETRSITMAHLSIDQLCMLLKYVVERLRDYPGSEPFCKPVDLMEVPNYLDYVIKPMDLSLLESNVRSKLYGSTDAFMADAKWIQHNCVVFNTCGGVYADMSKLTNAAKQIIKVARQEVSEIEACPDCYAHGRNLPRPQPSWFIEPCRRPHPLVWAKLKGFPFWPAKAMPRLNSQGYVDVRFFGEHDRAWVPPKDLFLYSEEPPAPSPRKRKPDMDECIREVTRHIRKLTLMFGEFKYVKPRVQYDPNNPTQIQLMLPYYNPLESNNSLPNSEFSIPLKKTTQKKRSFLKSKSQSEESIDIIEVNPDSKSETPEKEVKATMSKVQKLNTDVKNISNMQTDLNSSHSKLNRKNQEIIKSTSQDVAQNKTEKNYKPRNARTSMSRSNVALTDNASENNSTNSNASVSNKNNSSKGKNEEKSIKNLPKSVIQSGTESSDSVRGQRKSLLKNIINPKLALSQVDNSKTTTKYAKTNKAYKPKTRLFDKLNMEKGSVTASKENETLPNSSEVIPGMSLLNNNKESSNVQKNVSEIDIKLSSNASPTRTIPSTNPIVPMDKSLLLLVVNGKPAEPVQQVASTIDYQGNKDVRSVTKEGHNNSPKKESKARKSFPGRSPSSQNVQRTAHMPDVDEIIQVFPDKPNSSSTYQLLPPEAGPISARLHHDAHDLAKKMGRLMEEAYKEAAQETINGENGTSDNYQATIFFLRMQIEHIKWQHQQQLAELKHNTDRTLREMRASLEAEKLRSVEEVRKEVEEDKLRCIEETKRKQWCAKCGQEAMFYCCWNTAYCNYPCQQSHWPTHMRSCSQQPTYNTIVTNSSANLNPQQINNVMIHDSTSKAYSLPPNKLSEISSSSTSPLRNKINKNIL